MADIALKDKIQFVTWTPELLEKATRSLVTYAVNYSSETLLGLEDANQVAQQLVALSACTLALGEGGIIYFCPLVPGLSGVVNVHIWDPDYMGRSTLHRAALRFAMKHWDLMRLTALVPARHTLALRLAERVGFQKEGQMHNAILYNNGVDNQVVLGLLRQELEG